MIEFIIFLWVIGCIFTIGFKFGIENQKTPLKLKLVAYLLLILWWPYFLGNYLSQIATK